MAVAGSAPRVDVGSARILVQVAGLLFYLMAVQAMLTAGVGLNVYFSGGSPSDLLLPAVSVLLAGCYVTVGFFLRRHRIGARNFAFAFATVSLIAFPIGTILGTLVLVCIERANRAHVFGRRILAAAPDRPAEREGEMPVLRFEPELAAERAG